MTKTRNSPMTQSIVELRGCAPTPLAHYLKALGILRLVSEQADPTAHGWWQNDVFCLRSTLDETSLEHFFLEEYSPTPLVAPWNGGSGFYPKDNQGALDAIASGSAEKFHPYREVISICQHILSNASKGEEKPRLLQECRNRLPDNSIEWLDAAFILTEAGPKYPPLLGTGGNDGRLEFTNNFMQHLLTVLSPNEDELPSESQQRLRETLFGTVSNCRHRGVVGQYDPGNLGGANNGTGFEGSSTVNAWDYILMLEGAISFGAAAVRKLESSEPGALAYPFCVRTTGVGYGSADSSDEISSRAEMWLPLWSDPSSFGTVSTLLSEGRAEIGRRKAQNGVDFARAIASLGVDRGISEFERFGFQQRNGLAYLAVPLGRFRVKANPSAEELLGPLDHWLSRFRRAATGKNSPARAGRTLRNLESSILRMCQRGDAEDVQGVLVALGEAEAAVAISKQLREGEQSSGTKPLPLLDIEWLLKANDGTCEFRLAAALASIRHAKVGPLRRHLEPIDRASWQSTWPKWDKEANDPGIVWGSGSLIRNLNAVLARRLVEVLQVGGEQSEPELFAPLGGRCWASLGDITQFIKGQVDDIRIEKLLRALMLVNWSQPFSSRIDQLHGPTYPIPDAAYGLLKLCHLSHKLNDKPITLAPQVTRRAIAGDGAEATRLAARRLRASGFSPAVDVVPYPRQQMCRVAAALMFPISKQDVKRLAQRVLRCDPEEKDAAEPVTAVT